MNKNGLQSKRVRDVEFSFIFMIKTYGYLMFGFINAIQKIMYSMMNISSESSM